MRKLSPVIITALTLALMAGCKTGDKPPTGKAGSGAAKAGSATAKSKQSPPPPHRRRPKPCPSPMGR